MITYPFPSPSLETSVKGWQKVLMELIPLGTQIWEPFVNYLDPGSQTLCLDFTDRELIIS